MVDLARGYGSLKAMMHIEWTWVTEFNVREWMCYQILEAFLPFSVGLHLTGGIVCVEQALNLSSDMEVCKPKQ